jgi:hypothetical protein
LVVGLGASSVSAIITNGKKVDSCLRGKGYVVKID